MNKFSFSLHKIIIRFMYYIDLYCIEFYNFLLLINLYFQANLPFFQNKKRTEVRMFTKKRYDFLLTNV